MAFGSINFIIMFLPVFLAAYYITPKKYRNIIILIGSLGFYTWGSWSSPLHIGLLAVSVIVNYFFGRILGKAEKQRKLFLSLALIFNFGMLFVFKYSGFFAENINTLLSAFNISWQLQVPKLSLPLGISFFTFQSASYIIDVYRKKIPSEGSFIRLGAYICMFPKLIMGPITQYEDVSAKLANREYSFPMFASGLGEFVIGLGLNVLLSSQISGLWRYIDTMIGPDSVTTILAWLGAIGFSFQLYFDFCGFTLMAIGLGKMLGFELPQNFNYPYMARSMTEFWRRWHITLGRWFREYVYIPLGGNRKGMLQTIVNLLIVWLLTGIWHGASWNFVIWGLFLFVLIAIEKLGLKKVLDKVKPLGHIYMLIMIPLSWLIFNVTNLTDLGLYLSRLFPFFGVADGANINSTDYITQLKDYGVTLIICFVFATPLPRKLYEHLKTKKVGIVLLVIILAAVFGLSIYRLFMGQNDPNMYFRF